MDVFSEFESRIREIIWSSKKIKAKEKDISDLSSITVEIPRDPSHGDLATNAAMILAKKLGENPRVIASYIVEQLQQDRDVASVEIAGPGFINLQLTHGFWHKIVKDILQSAQNYGRSDQKQNIKINVEYVSANPTGPLHVGHCRGAVIGDVLANLLQFMGFDVTKEYYINDFGKQIDILAQSVVLRYRQALGENHITIPEGLYPGDYLIPIGQALANEFGEKLLHMPDAESLPIVKNRTLSSMMDLIREDLAALNIHHDVFFAEHHLHQDDSKAIREMIEDLTQKGYIYRGHLPAPKGHLLEEWEDREQVLMRSTAVGDDTDRPLIKSDSSYTYFAADVAYFKNKYERGFKEMIYVLGADHGGYVKRLEAVSQAIANGKTKLSVILCQLVKLYRAGQPIRMSKRSGNFVTLRDVVNEVGCDATRFMMLYRRSDAPLDFDFVKILERSRDNPVFYVQYAYARCVSVFSQACEMLAIERPDPEILIQYSDRLSDKNELGIIRKLAEYPHLLQVAALHREPHRLAFYLYDLAALFHTHWSKGNENKNLRFLQEEDHSMTLARLGLVQAIMNVLNSGLTLIGVSTPEKMPS